VGRRRRRRLPDDRVRALHLAQEGIKVHVAIINNGYLGMVRQWQQFFYGGRYAATPMRSPDFVKLADAHGLLGLRVTEREQIAAAVAAARAADRDGGHRLPRRAGRQRVPDGAAGADLHDMIRRPSPIVETASDD
jgi:acetolactate synthase-1/2/3 large subunit